MVPDKSVWYSLLVICMMNTGNRDLHFESEKEIEDVKLLVESMKYQKDDPPQQQQALRALGEILSQNSKLKSVIIIS